MALTVHRAERADVLAGRLAALLGDVPADPFVPDVVAVPSRGVERWLAQTLSGALGASARGDGVCANVVFPSPGRVVHDSLARAAGIEPGDDPWSERRLVWQLLEVVDGCATEAWCRTLGRHLGLLDGAVDRGRRMAVSQKLAALFTGYAAQRPRMVRQWLDGEDGDGFGRSLDPDLAWQAELYRRLRAHVGVPGPAERLEPGCARLREAPELVDLPDRLSFFGPTRLATDQLTVLGALAAGRDVHLWLPHPSEGLWTRIAEAPSPETGPGPVPARREDPTAETPRNPLVRSLGRDARELQLRLQAHARPDHEEHLPVDAPAGTLLSALQRGLREDRAPDGSHPLDPDDTSLQVHACHGRHRQVEVLREVLLGLLDDDPTLELRDVIVMCPDIESYAPLVSAAFGGGELVGDQDGDETRVHPGHRLTFRLADRSLRQTNPVLGVVARLLELADSRLAASEVLDLLAMPPVRRRFGLDDDALERVGDWVRDAGVRWGLDGAARAAHGLPGVEQNTWRRGLDRLLAGVAMDEDDLRSVGAALPLDDVDSTEVDLAGRLAEALDRLGRAVDAFGREQSVADWVAAIDAALESLVDVAPRDAWQLTQARSTLAEAAGSASSSAGSVLRLSDVRALLADRLAGRPTRSSFRTGHLTFCTMVPMRSVPHRVVCLLGLDDGVFPRTTHVDGDDVLARRPHVGERDRRSEDRQLFLDALLAAKERVVVLYTGADERTGAERPPAVPLGELLDVLERTVTSRASVRDQVVVRHPLQPFDARNFEDGALLRRGSLSFDRASYEGSRALRGGQAPCPPFLGRPLPETDPTEPVSLDSLVRFLEHPVRRFLQERLELRTSDEEDEPSDDLPVAPGALEEWQVGDRLLRAGLAGHPPEAAERVERLRGQLPPGRLGALTLAPVGGRVAAIVERSARLVAREPDTLDVSVGLPSGCLLSGTVPGVYGGQVVRVEYSTLSAKHRLRAWVQLLALCAHWPSGTWSTATVGRSRDEVAGAFLGGVPGDEARARLDELVRLYRLGLTRPLPVPPKTAEVYAARRRGGMTPDNAAAKAAGTWQAGNGRNVWGEFDDGDHRLVGFRTMDDLLAEAAPPELAAAWPDEPHLFGVLARAVWEPLLDQERLA